MKVIIVLVAILAKIIAINAASKPTCKVGNLRDYDWNYGYEFDFNIKDDHSGIVHTFETENVTGIKEISSQYLDATYANNVLTILTNENFKNFEEDGDFNYYYSIFIEIVFECTNDTTRSLEMELGVDDVNNHEPVLNGKVFEFNFGTTIPENYELTKFLPINATDIDFTNNRIYFSIGYSENLKIKYEGRSDYDVDEYSTTLKALKEIKAPFRQEFTLVATDAGTPPKSSTARLIVSVESRYSGNGDDLHPPVFSKHLYFADYTLENGLKMEEPITIKYGIEADTVIEQSGYEQYFKFDLDTTSSGIVKVTEEKSLPKNILEKQELLVVEIEAENVGLSMPGRTALVIRLPSIGKEHPEIEFPNNVNNNNNCSVAYLLNNSDESIFPLIIYMCVIFIIVVVNGVVLACYFQRRSSMVSASNGPYVTTEAINPEKFYKI